VLASVTDSLVTFATNLVRDGGLPAIFVLMLLESACIPIPSEATMLFAGFAVSDATAAHHHLTLVGIIVAGVLGNLVGSWIAYGIGYFGRQELVEGHRLRLKESHVEWADRWFTRYGAPSVFFARMLPIVRTFISLPAGIARMSFTRFTALTVIGCIPWVTALALIGNAVGSRWTKWRDGLHYVDYVVLALLVVGAVWLVVRRRRTQHAPA
jgi:membrane protein DedA with SNARE-associated domain